MHNCIIHKYTAECIKMHCKDCALKFTNGGRVVSYDYIMFSFINCS